MTAAQNVERLQIGHVAEFTLRELESSTPTLPAPLDQSSTGVAAPGDDSNLHQEVDGPAPPPVRPSSRHAKRRATQLERYAGELREDDQMYADTVAAAAERWDNGVADCLEAFIGNVRDLWELDN